MIWFIGYLENKMSMEYDWKGNWTFGGEKFEFSSSFILWDEIIYLNDYQFLNFIRLYKI
jgi:hypothetical protein